MRSACLLLVLACTPTQRASTAPPPRSASKAMTVTHSRTTWAESVATGVSGTCRDGDRFLAAPERGDTILPFRITARGVELQPALPLRGLPPEVDVESLAMLDDRRLLLGTEASVDARASDAIFIAKLDAGGVQIHDRIDFKYGPYGIRADNNRGIEGLCFTDGRIIAAAETVIERLGQRHAPIGSYDLDSGKWASYRLRLTSDTGKIAGLTCRKTKTSREVLAVERHYEVARILRFELPLLDGGGEIHAELVEDVQPLFGERPPNFESIERLDDGRILLVSDNHHGSSQGPTHLLLVTPNEPVPLNLQHGGSIR